jgi:hypothetical protein
MYQKRIKGTPIPGLTFTRIGSGAGKVEIQFVLVYEVDREAEKEVCKRENRSINIINTTRIAVSTWVTS